VASLLHRNPRHSHLQWPLQRHLPSLSNRLRQQYLQHYHALLLRPCDRPTERNRLRRRYPPLRRHQYQLPLLRQHRHRRPVLPHHLLRHRSPPKGRPPRSRSLKLVARSRRRRLSKRHHLRLLSPPSLPPRRLGMQKVVRRGLGKMRRRHPHPGLPLCHRRSGQNLIGKDHPMRKSGSATSKLRM